MILFKNLTTTKLFFTVIASLIFIELNQAQNAAQWRGLNRDGKYNETNLLNAWPDKGPNQLWCVEGIGAGYSSPSITSDKVFVNGELKGTSYLFAYDLNGKLLWKSPNGIEFVGSGFSSTYPGARSTPTVVNNLVYTCSGKGRIACFETATGKEIWSVDMVKDLSGLENEFGFAESLLIDDKYVYCNPGGLNSNFCALDRQTGKKVWASKVMGDVTAYCSPILVNHAGMKILISFSRFYLVGIDSKNGNMLWSYKLEGYKYDGEHCNTPIYDNGCIYYVSADEMGKGTIKMQISADGKSIKELWCNKPAKNDFGGFVKIDNKVFMTIEKNWLKALETDKGKVVDSIKMNYGSLIFADNKFISYGRNGVVSLIDYKQNKLEVKGKIKIEKGTSHHFAHPVVANGVMYIRHGDALMAYKIK